jgi:hypothetical protein
MQIGGSHVQRDVVERTLTEAAVRAVLSRPATGLDADKASYNELSDNE